MSLVSSQISNVTPSGPKRKIVQTRPNKKFVEGRDDVPSPSLLFLRGEKHFLKQRREKAEVGKVYHRKREMKEKKIEKKKKVHRAITKRDERLRPRG